MPTKDKTIQKVINCPIFTYHSFKEYDGKMDFCTTPDKFEEDLIALFDAGYSAISLRRYTQYIKDDTSKVKKHFVITMDDGYENNYTLAYPILLKHKVPASIFIVTSFVGLKTHPDYPSLIPHFSWNQASEMKKSGLVDIHSHGKWHKSNDLLHYEDLMVNMSESLSVIQSNLGKTDFNAYSYPNEKFSKQSYDAAKTAGYDLQMINFLDLNQERLSDEYAGRISVNYDSDILTEANVYKERLAELLR